jgi:DNA-binding response OmpR family regulator/outer membrane protein OmpA-like peptidoglycan-associated protein
MRILVIEDDLPLASFLQKGLQAESYTVDAAHDGETGLDLALDTECDLLVLDLNLPKMDGLTLLRRLRPAKPNLPVLVLTARSRVEDRVQALDCGADDCLNKPFSFAEVTARVRALARRGRPALDSALALKIADLTLDRIERRVERAGKRIELTSKEFALLEYLMMNTGRRVTRSMIVEHVWNLNFDTATNVVDVYINYASSQVDHARMNALGNAIHHAFQELGVMQDGGMNSVNAAAGKFPGMRGDLAPVMKLRREVNLPRLKEQLEKVLAQEIRDRSVALWLVPDGLVVSLQELAFFNSGSAAMRRDAQATFSRIITALRGYDLRIEGHTDNVPIRTFQFRSNWELSTARATGIIQDLITQRGFSPEQLSAAGYAEFHPVASNANEDGRKLNRRIDIVVLHSGTSPAAPSGP